MSEENEERGCLESKTINQHHIVKLNTNCFVDDDHIRETGLKLSRAVGEAQGKYFLVNLGNIAILSSMMIGQLVNVRNKCEEAKLNFQICDLSPVVAESLRIMNLDELLNVFPTESEALDASEL